MSFEQLPKAPFIVGALVALMLLEHFFPLRRQRRPQLPRLGLNAVLSSGTFLVAVLVMRPVTLHYMRWGSERGLGLVPWLGLPALPSAVLSFLLMDLSFYYWHRLNHRVPFLWRFHNVHHYDPDMDASTGFRFHFGEIFISTGFRVVQMVIIGSSLSTFFLFEFLFQLATYFHHSNLRLPLGLERGLNLILVTPRMHTVHHSQIRDEADSNYSVIFSWWDRLNGSFLELSESVIAIGVPGYANNEDNQLTKAVQAPFQKQRDYWRGNLTRGNHVAR